MRDASRALRAIPSVDRLLADPAAAALLQRHRRDRLVQALRAELDDWRPRLARGERLPAAPSLLQAAAERLVLRDPVLTRVVNATGVGLHTNLGRAVLPEAAIAALVLATMWLVGVRPFLLVHGPIIMLAASIGVWLFYVQHQFEETFWARATTWTMPEAALHGSSHYDLPPVLRWLTANIGVHHVHHMCSRIPYYRLPRVLSDHPQLNDVGRITLAQSLRCIRFALWDEKRGRMISFRQLRTLRSRAAR